MKKYFLFAAVAGMLASCSSESLTTGSDPKVEPTPQADLVPIEIGVATNQQKASTRGTGTVGDTDQNIAKNIWKGEKVRVLMYEIDANGNPTFNFTKDGAGDELYDNNTYLITPLASEGLRSGIAKEFDPAPASSADPYSMTGTGTTFYKVKYYPATGRSDFWGFYLGGNAASPAADDATGAVGLNNITATCDDGSTTTPAQSVNFVIDGSQDLMVAKAATGDGTNGWAIDDPDADAVGEGFTPTQNADVTAATAGDEDPAASAKTAYNSSYSAKAARKGLQPDLVFKHALTRLTFKVKAGNANAVGVTITAIKVHSMDTGELIVAYNYKNGLISADKGNSIIWDGAYDPDNDFTDDTYKAATPYTALSLQERDNVTGDMQALTPYSLVAADITTPHPIGEALLVAPQEKYWIEVEYDATTLTNMDWWDDSNGATSTDNYPAITKDLERTTPGDVFEPGKSYNVTITLYGPEKIEITTTLEPWTNVVEDITVVGE